MVTSSTPALSRPGRERRPSSSPTSRFQSLRMASSSRRSRRPGSATTSTSRTRTGLDPSDAPIVTSMILEPPGSRHTQSVGQIDSALTGIYSVATMARPKRGESVSLSIDDLAFGGEGVGRADGYVVFVPGGVPGDRVRVRLEQARSRFGRGVIEYITEPSPHRVEAPCPYFGRCGGCRLQHVAYPAQLAFKSKQVADALARLGGLPPVEIRPILPAADTYGYRNKMEFTVARTKDGAGLSVGLHEAERY